MLTDSDRRDLRLAAAANYAVAAAAFLYAALFAGLAGLTCFTRERQEDPAAALLFVIITGAFAALTTLTAALHVLLGRRLTQRRGHTFCIVVAVLAGANLLCAPIGAAAAVVTVLVLMRSSIKEAFRAEEGR